MYKVKILTDQNRKNFARLNSDKFLFKFNLLTKLISGICISTLMFTGFASAQSLVMPKRVETYVGGSFMIDVDNTQKSFRESGEFQKKNVDKKGAMTIRWGYREESTYGFEVGYTNVFKTVAKSVNRYETQHDSQGLFADFLLFFPVSPQISIYGKMGVGYATTKSIVYRPGIEKTTAKESRTFSTIGVGVEYLVTPEFAVRGGWETIKIKTNNTGTFTHNGVNITGLIFYE